MFDWVFFAGVFASLPGRAGPGTVRVDVEDDAHRFGVRIWHDGKCVTSIHGFALRTPWTLCTGSVAVLDRLVGMPLSPSPSAAYAYVRANEQCTHLFDAAALAVAHAKRGTPLREYDVDVPVVDASTPRIITVRRNGERVMNWVVGARTQILGPGIFVGKDIRSVLSWADGELGNPDDVEAVFVLRRAWLVSGCRNIDMDACTVASMVPRARMGACHVYQPGVAGRADRNGVVTLDFTDAPEKLLADLDAQLVTGLDYVAVR